MTESVDRIAKALADRYSIGEELGAGGMATVYLAEDLKHHRQVAIKVLRPELAAALGPERFLREIRITAQLNHPHILPLLDSGEAEGFLYYVMPYVSGESLRDRLMREGQLPIDEAVRIAVEVGDALDAAHERDILHRDVKPENILLQRGHALLADFGIARAVDEAGGDRLTDTGLSLGTPHYMSPEQAVGETTLTAQSDVYSLACVLYEMLAGEPPFSGPNNQAVLAKHLTGPRPSVRVVRDSVTPALDAALANGMARAPGDRYRTVPDFLAAVRGASAPAKVAGRRPRTLAAVLGLAVVAVAGAAVLWSRLGGPSGATLAAERIMVFPLVVSEGFPGSASIGEDIATLIGSTLDRTGPLRWIDGWTRLDPDQRQDIRSLSESDARALARDQGCRYYVSGRLLAQDDTTAQVVLTLYDVESGLEVRRSGTLTTVNEAWKGVRAVNALLPDLIGSSSEPASEWEARPPRAIASYLLGEAAFRRLRMEEAQEHFTDALAADSTFGSAALRGAQAASWAHRGEDAAALIERAVQQPLAPRFLAFARGYEAYLAGDADSAIAAFRAALAIDHDMAAAWIQLGETWTHLLPTAGAPDDSALAAFEQVMQIDSTATSPLFHMLQILLRRGDLERATPMLQRFIDADVDAQYLNPIRIMYDCVRLGASEVPWDSLARAVPFPLLTASRHLANGGAQLACAEAGFDALVRNDTAAVAEADNRRFFEIFGLESVLLAQGRHDEARRRVEEFVDRWGVGTSLFLLTAPYYPAFTPQAERVARADSIRHGLGYQGLQYPIRLWELGVYEAWRDNPVMARMVADKLAGSDLDGNRGLRLARSVEAHIALARADTSHALSLLGALGPPVAPGDLLTWDEALSGGADRLEYARLLAATGDARRALAVASTLESQAPFSYVLYLAPSLQVRLDAAIALGDTRLASRLRERLETLGGVAARP